MSVSEAKSVLAAAKRIQESAALLGRPPVEVTASHNEPVLPTSLFKDTRGYIEKIVVQVNRTYEHTCYDACAVMIRRLIEVLIIEAFEHHGLAANIQSSGGDFLYLQDLISATLSESSWNLGRNAKAGLRRLKTIGDQSAHSRRYNARRTYVDEVVIDLRTVAEELLYLAGMK
jgi:hypothetical protein